MVSWGSAMVQRGQVARGKLPQRLGMVMGAILTMQRLGRVRLGEALQWLWVAQDGECQVRCCQ